MSPWAIVDGAVLKGKLYVLTSYAEIGVLNLNSTPYVTLLEVKNTGYLHRGLQLLAYDEQLLMINGLMNGIGIMKEECQVYELNFMKMEWMRIQNFTDQALLLDYDMGSRFSNMTIWRWSQHYSNCIYNVGVTCKCILNFLDGRDRGSFWNMQGNRMPHFPLGVSILVFSTSVLQFSHVDSLSDN